MILEEHVADLSLGKEAKQRFRDVHGREEKAKVPGTGTNDKLDRGSLAIETTRTIKPIAVGGVSLAKERNRAFWTSTGVGRQRDKGMSSIESQPCSC